jgi:hypothetical protein
MTSEAVARFNDLPIQNASLSTILAKPYSKFVLELALQVDGEDVAIHELQFNNVADVVVDTVGMPWLGKVLSWKATSADEFSPPAQAPPHLFHKDRFLRFVIDTDRGHFEVVAEAYAFAMVQRSPSARSPSP